MALKPREREPNLTHTTVRAKAFLPLSCTDEHTRTCDQHIRNHSGEKNGPARRPRRCGSDAPESSPKHFPLPDAHRARVDIHRH